LSALPSSTARQPADALDEAVAAYLELQSEHFDEDVATVQEAIEDLHAGRSACR